MKSWFDKGHEISVSYKQKRLNGSVFTSSAEFFLKEPIHLSTLNINGKKYECDREVVLPVVHGWVLCFRSTSDAKDSPRFIVKIAPSEGQHERAKTSVMRFTKFYPEQKTAFFGSYDQECVITTHRRRFYKKYISMQISVLPYLGDDLAFLLESGELSSTNAEPIVSKIQLEYGRIKREFSEIKLGNLTTFNIILSWDKQKIYFIDQYLNMSSNELVQLKNICDILLEKKPQLLSKPIHLLEHKLENKVQKNTFESNPPVTTRVKILTAKLEILDAIRGKIIEESKKINEEKDNQNIKVSFQKQRMFALLWARLAPLQISHESQSSSVPDQKICLYLIGLDEAQKFVQEIIDRANQKVISFSVLQENINYLKEILFCEFLNPLHPIVTQALEDALEKKDFIDNFQKPSSQQTTEIKCSSLPLAKGVFIGFPDLILYQSIFDFFSLNCAINYIGLCHRTYQHSFSLSLTRIRTYLPACGLFIDLRKASHPERKFVVVKEGIKAAL